MEGRRPTDWELNTVPLEGRGSGKEKMKLAQLAGQIPWSPSCCYIEAQRSEAGSIPGK